MLYEVITDGAAQVAEVIHKMANLPSVIFDRDHVVAVAGVQKKEFNERRISNGLEELLENKKNYVYNEKEGQRVMPVEGINRHALAIFPIVSTGDVTGAVAILSNDNDSIATENQAMLAQTAALFLGKQVEE